MLRLITIQLSNAGWNEKGTIVNPTNIEETLQLLLKNKSKTNSISIYDKTYKYI